MAHHVNMSELKKRCMEWLHCQWDTVEEQKEIKDLMENEEGKQIMSELLNYIENKKEQ